MRNPVSTFLARKRFRPTLWPTLGLIALVVATVALGNWQRHRAEEKGELRAQYERAVRESPLQLGAPMTDVATDSAALRFRRVRVAGEFDSRAQVLIDNKVHAGQPGYHVVTPLRLAGGAYVLVDRGWVGVGARRSELPKVPPPEGIVTVEGRLNVPPARYLELRAGDGDRAAGAVWQNLDIARIGAASGLALLPFIVEQTAGPGDGLVRDWPAPDFGIEQHRSYMMQWYAFGLLGAMFWLGLNWRDRDPLDG
jgi:surfeit locus 1 family protein